MRLCRAALLECGVTKGHSRHFESPVQCGTSQQGGRGRPIGYVFMKLAGFYEECSWLRIFARFHFEKSRICWNTMKNFLFESLLQNPKVYFLPIRIVCPYDVELVTTSKNSWIKVIYWVQLPIVSGNLKKMLYSCLRTSFVSCYCVWQRK